MSDKKLNMHNAQDEEPASAGFSPSPCSATAVFWRLFKTNGDKFPNTIYHIKLGKRYYWELNPIFFIATLWSQSCPEAKVSEQHSKFDAYFRKQSFLTRFRLKADWLLQYILCHLMLPLRTPRCEAKRLLLNVSLYNKG